MLDRSVGLWKVVLPRSELAMVTGGSFALQVEIELGRLLLDFGLQGAPHVVTGWDELRDLAHPGGLRSVVHFFLADDLGGGDLHAPRPDGQRCPVLTADDGFVGGWRRPVRGHESNR